MNSKKLKIIWGIFVIFLLNLCMISIFLTPVNSESPQSTEVLSKMGSRGDEVRKIQTNLKKWGYYNGAVDGIYGAQTQAAVRKFQQKNKLTVDGVAGNKTLQALGINTSGGTGGGATQTNLNLLAKVISSESKGEPYTGQVAVGAVILNRVAHPSFPNTISGVAYQPGAFSVVDNGTINLPATASALRAAQDALNGWDPSGGSIYFYNPKKTSNQWLRSRSVVTQIGLHVFCK